MKQILPGDKLFDKTVIASVVYSDNEDFVVEDRVAWTLLLLNNSAPYFGVAIIEARQYGYEIVQYDEHENIVPAVHTYEQWGGDY